MLYSNLTYLLVARHVENDDLALPFILAIEFIVLLRLQGLLLNISYWYTYSFEI